MNYKYTIIKRTINGNYLATRHYERKSDAMKEVARLVTDCYQVEVMEYIVWLGRERQNGRHTA